MYGEGLNVIDAILAHERRQREERAGRPQEEQPQEPVEQEPFWEVEVKEEKKYGEELQERKENDIFSKPYTNEFLKALRPEVDEELPKGQKEIEENLARANGTRPFTSKVSLIEKPLEPEPRGKPEVPKSEPCGDPQGEELG